MGVSKVVLGEETLVDLTSDSVNEENLLEGATAHGADGEPVKGTVEIKPKTLTTTKDGEQIHLVDSTDNKVVEFALFGKATQNITTGKNLLTYPACQGPTYTRFGINFLQNTDGSVTVSGTHDNTTEKAYFGITPWWANTDNFERIPVYSNKTYKVTCKNLPDSWAVMTSLKSTQSGAYEDIESVSFYGDVESTYTPKQDGFLGVGLMQRTSVANEVITPFTCYPMIRFAEIEDDTYEPYTGGIPSPNPEYPQEIEVSGESYNLIPYPYYETTKEVNGITFTDVGNGEIRANGTANAITYFTFNSRIDNTMVLEAGEYVVSGCPSGGSDNTYRITVGKTNDSGSYELTTKEYGNGATFSLTEKTDMQINVEIKSGITVNNLTFKPMIRKASVKNDRYMLYGKGSVEVKSVGKNFFNLTKKSTVLNGITFTPNGDETFNVSGTATASVSIDLINNFNELSELISEGGDITFSLKNAIYDLYTCNISGRIFKPNSTEIVPFIPKGNTVNVPKGSSFEYLILWINEGVTMDLKNVGIQIEKGTATEWQPYKETKATIPTESGLAGIPVSSGGNYTDQNGQQWICDEVVKYADGSGAFIQRIYEHRVTTVNNYDSPRVFIRLPLNMKLYDNNARDNILSICNRFKSVLHTGFVKDIDNTCSGGGNVYGFRSDNLGLTSAEEWQTWFTENETIIYYVLEEPIHTPLTAEQIAEIEKVQTFYPVTNISNDADCGMNIEYVLEKVITTQAPIPVIPSTEVEELKSGDTTLTLFGKIKKWLASIKPHAFLNPVNNLLTTVSGSALDAMQGKVLDDKINALNDSLVASDNLKFQFATDGEGNYGYLKGDGTFVPFKRASDVYYRRYSVTRTSLTVLKIDIKSVYPDYANLTIGNIIAQIIKETGGNNITATATFTYSYSNGVITITASSERWGAAGNIVDVYIIPNINKIAM